MTNEKNARFQSNAIVEELQCINNVNVMKLTQRCQLKMLPHFFMRRNSLPVMTFV